MYNQPVTSVTSLRAHGYHDDVTRKKLLKKLLLIHVSVAALPVCEYTQSKNSFFISLILENIVSIPNKKRFI